mgnify:CR=1 FL=1
MVLEGIDFLMAVDLEEEGSLVELDLEKQGSLVAVDLGF